MWGVEPSSTEFLLINKNGLFKCRTARRVIKEKAFNENTLTEAMTTIDRYVNKGASTEPPPLTFDEPVYEGVPIERSFIPRRARLKPEDFDQHGFTDGCRGCIWLRYMVGPE